jgi:hypothetical protein
MSRAAATRAPRVVEVANTTPRGYRVAMAGAKSLRGIT